MKILLTNDDGINADGLWALYKHFSGKHDVEIVAPDRERSAVGHGITLNEPIQAKRVSLKNGGRGFAVSGTPADCIKLSILELLDSRPDVVISGINPGANVGVNINYSGTVSAAKEAALYGLPALAVSIQGRSPDHYHSPGPFLDTLIEKVMKKGLPFGTILNINFPDRPIEAISGVQVSSQGSSLSSEFIEKRIDSRNRTTYWHGLIAPSARHDSLSDEAALKNNCISITPIKCDSTDYTLLDTLVDWKIDTGN
ncbi:5'/3'-nucleotidase SurE [Thermodesulfobacteriota bacterium]